MPEAEFRRKSRVIDRALRPLGVTLARGLLPTPCASCGIDLGRRQDLGVCPDCWASVRPILRACPSCGIPAGERHGRCRDAGLDGVVTAVAYRGTARRLLVAAKSGGRVELLTPMAGQLAAAVRGRWPGTGSVHVVPVPSHPWAHLRRGFDAAAVLARAVAGAHGAPLTRALRRRLASPRPAKTLGAAGRRARARGSFRVRLGGAALEGAAVVLVDDVLTTGATAEACAAVLRSAGAGRVVLAAWGRTLL